MNIQKTEFVTSAVSPAAFQHDGLPQVAFAGRSNVGKSSVINRLLQRKNFARVGASPGKTIHINYFRVDGQLYFVDLPGYGYAKVSQSERERWGKLIEAYFASGLLTLGVMIVDARHAPTANDQIMANWFQQSSCPYVVVANKSEIAGNLEVIRKALDLAPKTPIVPFSAEKGTGREDLLERILAVV